VPAAQPSWGPLVYVNDTRGGSISYTDVGGCVMLADPTQAACGQVVADALQCALVSCAANCPLPTSSESSAGFQMTAAELADCMSVADDVDCQQYSIDAARCSVTIPSTSPAQFCFDGSLFSTNSFTREAALEKLFNLQCGQPDAGDGGDAGAD
jgi:hypothetical protein